MGDYVHVNMAKRPVRVGNVSGATGDFSHAMRRMVSSGQCDVVTGDWLSEMNIAWNAVTKQEVDPNLGYENGFYVQLEECLDDIVRGGIRVVTNAGALNTESLYTKVKTLLEARGYDHVVVAAVYGDDVSDLVRIVLCRRGTDASPVMGAAAWWHDWDVSSSHEQLAGSLLAAHLIECGPYVVGANFSGFKDFLPELVDLAFPMAEIDYHGGCVTSKTSEGGGRVTRGTVTAQLLYGLQGHLYLNPDAVADLSGVWVEDEEAANRVRVTGVKGLPPPPTTKVMVAAKGGFQAEAMFYINGLDVAAKAEMMRAQPAHVFGDSNFSRLSIELYGTAASNPSSQQQGTVSLRSYAGYHMNLDFRTMSPKLFMEMFPAMMSLANIDHRVALSDGQTMAIPPHEVTRVYPTVRPTSDTAKPVDLLAYGPSEFAPLGSIVHARSGDKADNSNVGFFVRHDDEYPWLRMLLSTSKLKSLLGEDWFRGDTMRRVERVEFPGINAVHFRIMDNLHGGIASSDRIDGLGKGIAEYLRSRYIDVPKRFLERGRI
ncbi:uncharacterized protein J7T54_001454 [Emericellopsis cladophorae]|uniref:Uncharacterized protein n=1 Tax=Emericellopsis cladophorae TaxID=2686198 RepID=A0A9Q0BDL2_9HYPO|nr:uncharacterized protein J7T54_001454 [Emericellopsis cladophorae]KAI6781492.1 hypothetical protein J7T54_001454 [Emericellopsis cladophorae]